MNHGEDGAGETCRSPIVSDERHHAVVEKGIERHLLQETESEVVLDPSPAK